MNDPIISVIIPVYNADAYLRRCIDSILCQTFKDFELIIVNDGSTDRSAQIIREYATNDDRIELIEKANSGASSARNVGIDNAKGRFICFVDADDYINEEYLAKLYQPDYDMVICGYKRNNEDFSFNNDCCFHDSGDFVFRYHRLDLGRTLWCKLMRRDRIGNIRFDERLRYGEDFLFLLTVLGRCSKIKSCQYIGYYYTEPSYSGKYILSANEYYLNLQLTESIIDKNFSDRDISPVVNFNRYLLLSTFMKSLPFLTTAQHRTLRYDYIKHSMWHRLPPMGIIDRLVTVLIILTYELRHKLN